MRASSSPASNVGPARLLLFCVLLLAMSTPSDAGGGLQPSNTPVLSSDLLILHAALVFFMQMGFVSLESGQGRAKNVRNILLKNLVDVLLSGLSWWAVGYAFSSPPSAGGFIGYHNFFDESSNSSARPWFFSWTFALCTGTIVSGCLAERTSLITYPVYTVVLTAWIHPMIANWAWSPSSWMHQINDSCAFLDFAGGAVVHVSGGLMGLIGAAICGPRLGRFEDGATKPIPGHDMSAVTLGTFFLWFGWYGFNCGSTYLYLNPSGAVVNRVAINMTLAGCASGLTALGVASVKSGSVDLVVLCNGVLSGLVCATAFCGFFTPWASAVLGLVAGGLYVAFSKLLLKLHVDDPLDSSAIHLGSGLLGTMSLAMLAKPEYVEALTGSTCGGFVYTRQGWLLLGMQLLGIVVIVGWTAVWALCVFYPLHYFGRLRVDQATELAGIDNIEHGGPAYPEFNLVPYTSGSAER